MSKKSWRNIVVFMLLTILARAFSFARDIILSYKYGAGSITDAYSIALTIPLVMFSGIGTAIYTCYVPIYKNLEIRNKNEIKNFNGNIIKALLVLSGIFIAFFYINPNIMIKLFALGLSKETTNLTVNFAKIMIWTLPFMGVGYILQGYLQAENKVYLIAFMTGPASICTSLAILISDSSKLYIMGIGALVSYMILVPYYGIPAYSNGFRSDLSGKTFDNNVKEVVTLLIPVLLGLMLNDINVIVDKNFASSLVAGTVTSLDLANKVALIFHSLIGTMLATVFYSQFVAHAQSNKIIELRKILTNSIHIAIILLIPCVIVLLVFSEEIIRILFYHGTFDSVALRRTSISLVGYSIGILPISIRIIIEKVFYAMKDTKSVVKNSFFGIIVNIVSDIILIRFWGIFGLALATSISAIVSMILLYYRLENKIGDCGVVLLIKYFIKVILASAPFFCLFLIKNSIVAAFGVDTISLIIVIVMLFVFTSFIYFILLWFLRVPEVMDIIDDILVKLKRLKNITVEK